MALDRFPHLIRFGMVGSVSTLVQLILLVGLVRLGLEKSFAHALAIITSAQLSFFLSREVTWVERRVSDENVGRVVGKLARFNGMMAVSLLVNQLTFDVAALRVEYLIAGVAGVVAAAAINYTVSDRFVFPLRQQPSGIHRAR